AFFGEGFVSLGFSAFGSALTSVLFSGLASAFSSLAGAVVFAGFFSAFAGSASWAAGSGSTMPVDTKMIPRAMMRTNPATMSVPAPAKMAAILWDLAQVVTLFMMTLLLALSAGQSLLRLARVLVGRSKTIRCSLRLQYLQRLNSYVCTPMWHHKALSPSYGCTVGSEYTLLIFFRG